MVIECPFRQYPGDNPDKWQREQLVLALSEIIKLWDHGYGRVGEGRGFWMIGQSDLLLTYLNHIVTYIE